MLSHRRFSRPVLSTTQPSLRACKSIFNSDAGYILPHCVPAVNGFLRSGSKNLRRGELSKMTNRVRQNGWITGTMSGNCEYSLQYGRRCVRISRRRYCHEAKNRKEDRKNPPAGDPCGCGGRDRLHRPDLAGVPRPSETGGELSADEADGGGPGRAGAAGGCASLDPAGV